MLKSIVSKSVVIVCIGAAAGLIAFLALPLIIDIVVLPGLLEKTVFSSQHASVSRITPYQLSGTVSLTQHGRPSVSISRFNLHFTPPGVLHKKFDSLELSHAVFHLYRQGDRLVFPGTAEHHPVSPSPSSSAPTLLLPLGVDQLILDQCRIIIHDESGRDVHIGVSGRVEPEFSVTDSAHLLKSVSATLQLFDDVSASLSAAVTVDTESIQAELTVENGNLNLPNEFLPPLFETLSFGSLSSRLTLELDRESYALDRYTVNGSLGDVRYRTGQVELGRADAPDGVRFALSGSAREHRFEVSDLALNSPIRADIGLHGSAIYENARLQSDGALTIMLHSIGETGGTAAPLMIDFDGSWSAQSGYQVKAGGEHRFERQLTLGDNSLILGLDHLQFSATVNGDAERTHARFNLKSEPLSATYARHRVQTSPFELTATGAREGSDFAARVSGTVATVGIPEAALRVAGVRFSLPVTTGPVPPSLAGDFSSGSIAVDSITQDGEPLAGLSASISRQESGYSGSGSIEALFNKALRIDFNGEASPLTGTGRFSWNLAPTDLTPSSLPALVPLPPDLDFTGTIAASGLIEVDRFTPSASLLASLNGASLELSDSGLSIESIDCAVEFPELPRVLSSPSQTCTTGPIDLASLHFDDSDITFRVEDYQSVFIEKSRLSWCGGRLDSSSVRLSTDTAEIETTLYCSRIGLASLLEQFGFGGTEGEGSLNGSLPVRMSGTSLEFDDGFLFSTPGTGGIIRFTDTELLRQGMGAVSETGYIGYSLAALEDFAYNWTKLSFDSSADDLLLTLELDGRPRTPMPFKFDKKGMIVESSKGKGLQYPIRLDVNFRLPLAEMFRAGQSLNSLMGNN